MTDREFVYRDDEDLIAHSRAAAGHAPACSRARVTVELGSTAASRIADREGL
jgi:hypothetical protein